MIGAIRRFLGDRRGVAAVEAALIMPIMLLLVAGIIEYSRAMLAQHMVRDIIDEAARTGAVTGKSTAATDAAVTALVDDVPGISAFDVDVTTGTAYTVTVTVRVDLFFGSLLPSDVVNFTFTAQYPL